MTLLHTATGETGHKGLDALPLPGPVFIGSQQTWLSSFTVVGMEHKIADMIEGVSFQGEVRTGFLGWNSERWFEPISYVSCQSITDYVLLKMMLSG
jgi:hypothetical protein